MGQTCIGSRESCDLFSPSLEATGELPRIPYNNWQCSSGQMRTHPLSFQALHPLFTLMVNLYSKRVEQYAL